MPQVYAWVVDPLIKVFPRDRRDTRAPTAAVIEAARNDVESAQVALRCTAAATVHAIVSPVVHADGDDRIDEVRLSRVGCVHLDAQTADIPKAHLVRAAPGPFPDVLLNADELHLGPNETQSLWITVAVPATAKPGAYRGQLTLTSGRESTQVPIELTVYGVAVPRERTYRLSQWMSADTVLARHIPGASYPSETFFRTLRNIARNMRAHRQNVLRLPFGPAANGPIMAMPTGIDGLAFDFTGFDRFVDVFTEAGAADVIAGAPLAAQSAIDPGTVQVAGLLNAGGCIAAVNLRPEAPEAKHFLDHYLAALYHHLQLRGLTGRYVQHVLDDPEDGHAGLYQALAARVRALMPGIPICDAAASIKVAGETDTAAPPLDYYLDHQRWYRDRQREGREVWVSLPGRLTGRFPNRFIDRSLLDLRLVHWMSLAFGATGLMHRGYNEWEADDVTRQACVAGRPGGDAWIVYPMIEGVLDSIRHEAMRDGVEDYELLRLLSEDHPRQALSLVKAVVKSGTNYTASVNTFRRTRRQLLELLSG